MTFTVLPTEPTANEDQFGEQDSSFHSGFIAGASLVFLIIFISITVAIGYWIYRKRQNLRMLRQTLEPTFEIPDAVSSMELHTTTKNERDKNVPLETNYMGLDNRVRVGDEGTYQSLQKESSYQGYESPNGESVSTRVYQSLDRKPDPTYQSLAKTGQQQQPEGKKEKENTVAMETHYMDLGNRVNDVYQSLNGKSVVKGENKLRDDLKPRSRDRGCHSDDQRNHDDYQPLSKLNKDNDYQSLDAKKQLSSANGSESPVYDNTPQHIDDQDGLYNGMGHDYEPVREGTNEDEAVDTPSYEILPP